jgi:DNA repair exonuclease SbcCD ATPase subunit
MAMDPQEPTPPRPVPPAPPRPEWIKPPALPSAAQAVTPMMEFFQRRVENLERELSLERERAASAQSLIAHQESLKNEVDQHLKALTDQLKREKIERESEESKSHSRGRVEALEKRLDEMNSTFAQLLKDAVSSRGDGGPSAAALAAELASFRGALKDGMDGVARWRGELRELSALVPQVQGLTERLPQDEKLFEESVGRRLDEFSARLARSLEDWKRSQELERAELDARVEALARERGDLARVWESQSRAQREEQFKERVARDVAVERQVGALAERLDALSAAQDGAAKGADGVRAGLDRVISILTQTPKAKDAVIEVLEAEKAEYAQMARERVEALRRFAAERREVEKSMGDGLLKLTSQLEDERANTRAAEARVGEVLGRVDVLQARVRDMERQLGERDERLLALAAERDEIARTLFAETAKVARAHEERRAADAASDDRLSELRRRLDEEVARRTAAEGAAVDSRLQMTALAEQTARTFQERDATLARFSDWEKERQRLLESLRKKDEMISMLSATFQGALKKAP